MDEPAVPASPAPHPLLAYQAPAHVLLDRVQFGFDMQLPTVPAARVVGFCADLARRGVIARRPGGADALAAPLAIGNFSVALAEGGVGSVGGQVAIAATPRGHLAFTRRSRIVMNPMRDPTAATQVRNESFVICQADGGLNRCLRS